ncbi:MAG: solute carrier family 23 protein, partial [Halanaerobium sp.]
YNPMIIQLTAVIVILSSFVQKVGVLIQTIPTAVMGGIVFLLFGMIASIGLRTLVENEVDLSKNRNLVIVSVTLVVGISNLTLNFAGLEFGGMGLAAIVGIVMNLVLPAMEKEIEDKELEEELKLEAELQYEAN